MSPRVKRSKNCSILLNLEQYQIYHEKLSIHANLQLLWIIISEIDNFLPFWTFDAQGAPKKGQTFSFVLWSDNIKCLVKNSFFVQICSFWVVTFREMGTFLPFLTPSVPQNESELMTCPK